MEIRWCWAAFILLTVVTHNPASSTTDSRQRTASASADDSTLEKRRDSLKPSTNLPKSSSSIESNYNLDEIITNRETVAAASSVKKYLKKESKKQRKKYVSNDDYRTTEAIPEHLEESPDSSSTKADSEKPHSRKKRLIWVTDDGRLALPPGTSLTIAPTIALPFVRYPPTGFLSNISISLPVTIDFDKLGLTDNQNPLGVLPPLFARSMGRAAGSILADYVSDYMRIRRRRKRSVPSSTTSSTQGNANFKIITSTLDDTAEQDSSQLPDLPEEHKHAFHGGERALLYTVVEDFIANFGLDGRACMLRAICEVHSKPMEKFGLVGEILKLFFTASLSPYSEHLDEYVSAEQVGKGTAGPGECFPYYKDCPKSLFRVANNFQQPHYGEADSATEDNEGLYDEVYGNSIDDLEREIRSAKTAKHGSSSSVESKEDTVVQLDSNISQLVM